MKKILITGANGMLGSALCNLFFKNNSVYAFHRNEVNYAPCKKEFRCDLIDFSRLKKLVHEINPDIIIHSASMTNVDNCEKDYKLTYKINTEVTENISNLCKNKIKMIYLSTDQVYGNTDYKSEKNLDLLQTNLYAKTKYLGEKKVVQNCENFIIIRTNIFGWNMNPNKVSSAEWIYNSLKLGQNITLFHDYYFSPIFSNNLCRIIEKLIQLDFTGILNLGSSKACSKYDFGVKIAKAFSFDEKLINKDSIKNFSFAAERPKNLELDISLAEEYNIKLPTWEESVYEFCKII